MSETPKNGVEFGWGAPMMIEQHPVLKPYDASRFDEDNRAIIRCHLRCLITDSQRDAAYKKLTKNIEVAIRDALKGGAQ